MRNNRGMDVKGEAWEGTREGQTEGGEEDEREGRAKQARDMGKQKIFV
jgi:hypothetical protein